MYSTRFNGCPKSKGDHDQTVTVPGGPSPPSSPLSKSVNLIIFDTKRRRRKRDLSNINTFYYMHSVGNAIDSGIGLSITIDNLRVFINKTLSILSAYQ